MGRKIGSALLVFSFLAAPVLGATPGTPAPPAPSPPKSLASQDDVRNRRVQMQLRQLSADLGLSEDQKAQIKPILESKAAEIRALRMDQSLDPQEKESRLSSIQEQYRSQIQNVLTAEQSQKLVEIREKRKLAAQQTYTQKRKGKVPVQEEEE